MLFSIEEFQQLKYYSLKFGIKFHKSQATIGFSLTILQPLILQWQHTRRGPLRAVKNFIKHKKNTFKF